MEKNSIIEEIEICKSILEKFKAELADCKNDYDTLKKVQNIDADKPEFQKALMAVKERYDDITLSVKLIKARIEKLTADLEQ